jgi:hypothetical protein
MKDSSLRLNEKTDGHLEYLLYSSFMGIPV